MTRTPFSYPLGRSFDTDGGGAADLQTDVMRFMAILSLCLVAIFALVQSLPLRPAAPEPPAANDHRVAAEKPPPQSAADAVTPPVPSVPPAPPVQREALPPAPAYSAPRAQPVPDIPLASPEVPVPQPASAPPSSPEPVQGFVLRFASDRALYRLVETGTIGLYAMQADENLRLNISGGNANFWPASKPRQFHEMDAGTVPAGVLSALRRNAVTAPVTWGVTLPAALRTELNAYLRERSGGTLVIAANGTLSLEP